MKVCLGLLLLCAISFAEGSSHNMTQEHMLELVQMLVTQIQLQQFQIQERIRSEGDSGLKQMRIRQSGSNNYNTETHSGGSIAASHTHSNSRRTVGLGEFIAVLNGVEFRSRHNDYRLVMPSTTSKDLNAVEEIPYPDIPPEVLEKNTVEDQSAELREFFKAWRDQNTTHRNYVKYFKPVLCYLEGAWFKVKPGGAIQESFFSERHALDAKSWTQLHANAQFMAHTGAKNRLENLAMLPTAFMGTINGTMVPQLCQFNYRILCHPLKKDLPLNYIHVVEDLSSRYFRDSPKSMDMHEVRRGARFALNSRRSKDIGGQYINGLLDELMSKIPGKDNYLGKIETKPRDEDTILSADGSGFLNKAYYSRIYQVKGKDAMGLNFVHRSYSDAFAFGAQTTHEKICGMDLMPQCVHVNCKKGTEGCNRHGRKEVCPPHEHEKWTWAIPLEIIYMTPLHAWNPYNITDKPDAEVTAGGRNGQCSNANKAYDGAGKKLFFRTPVSFFTEERGLLDAADTVSGAKCVLNSTGQVVKTTASGVYIHLPPIQNLGQLRIRYPIMPVHGEGSSVWKELNALRHFVMNRNLMDAMVYQGPNDKKGYTLVTAPSRKGESHKHEIQLSAQDWKTLAARMRITVTTSQNSGHTHMMKIRQNGPDRFQYITCDGENLCKDRHSKVLRLQKSS